MEEDRAVADLGPTISADLNGDDEAVVEKKPKRRFIGRKAADAKAAARAEQQSNGGGGIEDSGAVQGAESHPAFSQHHHPAANDLDE
jgi:2-(3-amino-3-carboxypropyl)histidine synthase